MNKPENQLAYDPAGASSAQKSNVLHAAVFAVYNVFAFVWVVMCLSILFLVSNQAGRIAAVRQFCNEHAKFFNRKEPSRIVIDP